MIATAAARQQTQRGVEGIEPGEASGAGFFMPVATFSNMGREQRHFKVRQP
jgi:hypothetical protein